MDRNSDFKSGFAISIGLLAALAGSYFFLNEPLVSLRPDQGSVIDDPTSEAQFVRARLWQDPLLAAYADWNARPKPGTPEAKADPLPHHVFKLPGDLVPGENQNVLRLLVMQGEETYVEDIEQRRRQRYALISALTGEDYVPNDEAHIGYFLARQFDPAKVGAAAADSTMLIAYETFEYFDETPVLAEERGASDAVDRPITDVHVFWLNSTDFDENVIARLTGLLAYIDNCTGSVCQPAEHSVTNVVLGPNSTGELTALYEEQQSPPYRNITDPDVAKRNIARQNMEASRFVMNLQVEPEAAKDPAALTGYRPVEEIALDDAMMNVVNETRQRMIFIPSNVTGPLDRILKQPALAIKNPQATDSVERVIANYLGVAKFRSSILRDDIVLARLLDELEVRGICSTHSQPVIFAISEQDTMYGRILDDLLDQGELTEGCTPLIREIGYLRGVDGEMPLNDAYKTAEASSAPANEKPQDEEQTVAELFAPPGKEQMAGPAQLDYLSRLADKIMREAQRLQEEESGPIVIGVLGSDVYDKLLILQSLKDRLPSALFFTTDLDSRLAGREVYKWTRNLLVASSHNLEYDNEMPLESDAKSKFHPVFRDAYQTSFYQATLMALDMAANQPTTSYLEPRLFEIGRTGPLELTRNTAEESADEASNEGVLRAVSEDRRFLFTNWRVPIKFLLSVPLLLFLAWCVVMRLFGGDGSSAGFLEKNEEGEKINHRHYGFDQAIVVVGTALLVKLLFLCFVPVVGSEPLYLFEGISIFPVLSLQLSTFVMAVALVLITRGRLAQADINLHDDFCIRWVDVAERTASNILKNERLDIHQFWSHYTWNHNMQNICYQSLGAAALTTALVWIAILVNGTETLLTGELSFRAFGQDLSANPLVPFLWMLSLFSVLLMYFVCIRVYSLACRLMKDLSCAEMCGWQVSAGPVSISNARQAMRLIVELTKIVTPIIYYPFFLLTMLLLSRNSLFEGWVWNWLLLLIFAILVLYIFYQAATFQKHAVAARDAILERLEDEKADRLCTRYNNHSAVAASETAVAPAPAFAVESATDKENRKAKEQAYDALLIHAIEEIKSLNSGAFVHWTSHPLFRAIALPSSSLGILTLLLQ